MVKMSVAGDLSWKLKYLINLPFGNKIIQNYTAWLVDNSVVGKGASFWNAFDHFDILH